MCTLEWDYELTHHHHMPTAARQSLGPANGSRGLAAVATLTLQLSTKNHVNCVQHPTSQQIATIFRISPTKYVLMRRIIQHIKMYFVSEILNNMRRPLTAVSNKILLPITSLSADWFSKFFPARIIVNFWAKSDDIWYCSFPINM